MRIISASIFMGLALLLVACEGDYVGVPSYCNDAYESGLADGYYDGRKKGRDEGRAAGFDEGRDEGFDKGRDEGRTAGFDEGRQMGRQEVCLAIGKFNSDLRSQLSALRIC